MSDASGTEAAFLSLVLLFSSFLLRIAFCHRSQMSKFQTRGANETLLLDHYPDVHRHPAILHPRAIQGFQHIYHILVCHLTGKGRFEVSNCPFVTFLGDSLDVIDAMCIWKPG